MVDVLAAEAASLADPSAFRFFYDDALPRLYAYFVRRCGDRGVAEELTQETFVAAVAEIRKRRPIAEPLHWIFGIARHKLVDHYRTLERTERRDARTERVNADPKVWDTAGERDVTARALAALPVAQRAALVLRYLDDLPVADVARALGRSLHATESLIARGKEGFRRVYPEVDS